MNKTTQDVARSAIGSGSSTEASSCCNYECIVGELGGKVIKDRIMICNLLDYGSFGKIYKCIDFEDTDLDLVMKVSDNCSMIAREYQAMREISMLDKFSDLIYPYSYTPKVYHKGVFVKEKPVMGS
jgi:hypothetical protein